MSTHTRSVTITPCTSSSDLAGAATLFTAYVKWLDIDLSFQDFAGELASLPGKYAASNGGCLLLAKDAISLEVIGVVALRALDSIVAGPGACEMKRLYVSPAGRGRGVGRKLAEAVIVEAERFGYRSIWLDTLPHMTQARGLYQMLGFQRCERYYETPVLETIFMRKELNVGESG